MSLRLIEEHIKNRPNRHIFIGEKDALRYDDYEIDLFLENLSKLVAEHKKQHSELAAKIVKELWQTPVGADWSESHFRSLLSHIAQNLDGDSK